MRGVPTRTSRRCARSSTARGVDHVVDDALVRGLDYYTRTAWEFIPVADGRAQSTISGGGRYDGLAEQIGGKRTPGVGFGGGVERVVLALESAGRAPTLRGCDWFCAVDAPAARPRSAPCSTRRETAVSPPRWISQGAA